MVACIRQDDACYGARMTGPASGMLHCPRPGRRCLDLLGAGDYLLPGGQKYKLQYSNLQDTEVVIGSPPSGPRLSDGLYRSTSERSTGAEGRHGTQVIRIKL
jgi:hypothetical protein